MTTPLFSGHDIFVLTISALVVCVGAWSLIHARRENKKGNQK
jgi:hypothetical protein